MKRERNILVVLPSDRYHDEVCRPYHERIGNSHHVSMNPIMIDGTGMCGACRLVVGDQVKFACVDGPEFDGHLVDFNLAMKRLADL